MQYPRWMLVLAAASACATAQGTQSDASSDTPPAIDAAIDGNGCAMQPCSILPQCGCNGGNACDLDGTDDMGTACRAVDVPGTETATCSSLNNCDKGYVCLGGASYAACKKYCSADAECGAPRGQCVVHPSSGGMPIAGIPAVCSSNCEPTSTNSPECPQTFKCSYAATMNNGASVNIAQCTPAGTGTQGTVCGTAGTQGSDNMCAKGYTCSTITTDNVPRCRRMCQKAASNCGAAMCLSYSPVYTINGVEYGICQ